MSLAAAFLLVAALPFGPGERITMKVTYARILAGHATMTIESARHGDRDVLRFVQEVRSQGVFAWLFRYRVDNRLVASWDPETGCSYGIQKRLRQGRFMRDQQVTVDPVAGKVLVKDGKHPEVAFQVKPCVLDVLSAFYVARARGLPATGTLSVPVYDSGRVYDLAFRVIGRETLDLPLPLGRRVRTVIVEPQVPPGSGLFAQEGELRLWVTDDARRIPVRARTSVAVGSVSADLETYEAGKAVTASPYGDASARPRSTSDRGLPTPPNPR